SRISLFAQIRVLIIALGLVNLCGIKMAIDKLEIQITMTAKANRSPHSNVFITDPIKLQIENRSTFFDHIIILAHVHIHHMTFCTPVWYMGWGPWDLGAHVATIYTETGGYLDSLEIEQVKKFLDELRKHLKDNKPQFQEIISSSKTFIEQAETLLKKAIQEQLERFPLQEQT
ncbi:hypothetical protein ACJX0J_010075, partial [Zea mays]